MTDVEMEDAKAEAKPANGAAKDSDSGQCAQAHTTQIGPDVQGQD